MTMDFNGFETDAKISRDLFVLLAVHNGAGNVTLPCREAIDPFLRWSRTSELLPRVHALREGRPECAQPEPYR